MWHEPAEVSGDAPAVFPDAEASGFVVHDPDAHHGMIAAEVRQIRRRLIDETFLAIFALGALDSRTVLDECDVGAFAAELGLLSVVAAERLGRFKAGKQVRMIRKQLPEDWQEPLVAQQHLPDGLDE